MYEARQNKEKVSRRIDEGGRGVRQRMLFKDDRINSTHVIDAIQRNSKKQHNLDTLNTIQRAVLSRSMQNIVDNTIFETEEDITRFFNVFSLVYAEETVNEMIERILNKNNPDEGYMDDFNVIDNEYGANITYHGDLNEYDNPNEIDQTIASIFGSNAPIQRARKPFTISGPKSYIGTQGNYKNITYITGAKGDINFETTYNGQIYKSTVLSDSYLNLDDANVTFDNSDRRTHFALADMLYSARKKWKNISESTNYRQGKYTWHHLVTPHWMVLVDMEVHKKHGHNGGVYLW